MRKIVLAAAAVMALPLAASAAPQSGQQGAPAPNAQQSNMQSPTNGSNLGKSEVRQIQQALDQKGFKAGRADGVLGRRTKEALNSFQKSRNLPVTGQADQPTLAALGVGSTTGQGSRGDNGQMQKMQTKPSGQNGAAQGQNQKK